MADDKPLRSYRSQDRHLPGVESTQQRDKAKASDPLAELARLIGQSDPFAELGRNAQRQPHAGNYSQPDPYPAHDGYAPADDWPVEPARDQRGFDHPRSGGRGNASAGRPAPVAYDRPGGRHSRYDEEPAGDQRYQTRHGTHSYPDEGVRDDRTHGAHDAGDYELDDEPLEPDDEAMYDDAPRKRRHGLTTALALIGCAMLGTAGAYAYRSYYSHAAPGEPPPVITADSATPTKIVPIAAGSSQSSKINQERLAPAGKEQVVSKQEEPIAIREIGTQAAPRVVLPAPVAPVAPVQTPPSVAPGSPPQAAPTAVISTEPRRVRTVVIRPDGTDPSARPVVASPPALPIPSSRSPTPPAPRAAPPPRNGSGPISLDPQSAPSEPAAQPRARTAAAPADRSAPEAATGVLVQLSSQKTEADALASFRSLQAKFPNELGGRQPIVRRVDLGSKGVYYRTNVGPFPSAQEASKFCTGYKAAGGQCVVPTN